MIKLLVVAVHVAVNYVSRKTKQVKNIIISSLNVVGLEFDYVLTLNIHVFS